MPRAAYESKPWSAEEDAYLKHYYLQHSAKMIGDFLERSASSVTGRAHRLGLHDEAHQPTKPRLLRKINQGGR